MKDPLDTAIDHVAARLVHVQDDAEMTERIVRALPERPRLAWLLPQFALIGVFAIAAMVWMTQDTSAPPALLPASSVGVVASLPAAPMSHEPGTALRTQPLESASARNNSRELRRDRAVAAFDREGGPLDHERSLPALEAVNTLIVNDVSPRELPASSALAVAPIGVTDLPLTAESFLPR